MPAVARGMCRRHYLKWRRAQGDNFTPLTSTAVERFWSHVDKQISCWLWTGTMEWSGYGNIFVNGNTPRLQKAHRFSYELLVGPIPEGLEIDHTCHTKMCPTPGIKDLHRRCVNPAHLEAVTRAVNIDRGQAPELTRAYYRAAVTHCPWGHEYTEENTRIEIRRGWSTRHCRACNRRRRAEFLAQQKNAPPHP